MKAIAKKKKQLRTLKKKHHVIWSEQILFLCKNAWLVVCWLFRQKMHHLGEMESSVLHWHPSLTRTPLSAQFGWQSLRTVQWCRSGEMGMWARAKHDGRAPARLFYFFDFQSCLTIHPLTRLCQMPPPNIVMPKIHPSCKLCVWLIVAMAFHGGTFFEIVLCVCLQSATMHDSKSVCALT